MTLPQHHISTPILTLHSKPQTDNYDCAHCDSQHTRSTGVVLKDDQMFAVYHAYLHNEPASHELPRARLTVLFADWEKSLTRLVNATAFGIAMHAGKTNYELMLQDPTAEAVHTHAQHLTRAEALAHPRLQDVWDVVDFSAVTDPDLHALLYGHLPKSAF